MIHFVGDRFYDGVSKYLRFDKQSRIVLFGRRIFHVHPDGQNVWEDVHTGRTHVWELPKPAVAPTLELLTGDRTGVLGWEIVPNPFSNFTNIRVAVASDISVKVIIMDINLEHVKTLEPTPTATANAEDGFYDLKSTEDDYVFLWDGTRENERGAARGAYFAEIQYLDADGNVQGYDREAVIFSPEGAIDPDEESATGDRESDAYDLSDLGELVPGSGMRRANYLICYTWYSSVHGIETPPSPFSEIRIVSTGEHAERQHVFISISDYQQGMPTWCDQVRFYAKRTGNKTNFTEPKDIPFDFEYIGGPGREDLVTELIATTYNWANESVGDPPDFLRSKEFETLPNQDGIEQMIVFAGRMWAYDKDVHSIRFSHINAPDVMPYDDTRIVQAIRIDGSWQARVEALHVMPGDGGIFVFFPRAIRAIRGQQIVTGLHTVSISPETDVDATGGINGKGTRSPDTIVSYGSVVFYLDTDRKIYALSGGSIFETQEFSLSIQPFLDIATQEEIREARAEIWESRYHLMLGDRTYILDMQRNYWTIWDVKIDSIVHSVGGDADEDVLYALIDDEIVELYTADAPDNTEWMWVTNFVDLPINSRISEVYLPHPEQMPQKVEMRVETERGLSDWKEYQVHVGNFFRLGTFANADVRVRVYIRGYGDIPRFNELTIGVN